MKLGFLIVDSVHEKRHWFLTKKQALNWIRYDVLGIMNKGYVIVKHGGKIKMNRVEV